MINEQIENDSELVEYTAEEFGKVFRERHGKIADLAQQTDRREIPHGRRASDARRAFAKWTIIFAVLIFLCGAATGYYLGSLEAVKIWRENQ